MNCPPQNGRGQMGSQGSNSKALGVRLKICCLCWCELSGLLILVGARTLMLLPTLRFWLA